MSISCALRGACAACRLIGCLGSFAYGLVWSGWGGGGHPAGDEPLAPGLLPHEAPGGQDPAQAEAVL